MRDEYVDALAVMGRASLWQEFHEFRNQSIPNRPSYLKDRLLAIAQAPIEQDARLLDADWTKQCNTIITMADVLLQTVADSLLHPSLGLTFPSYIERDRAKLDAKLAQARMIDEVLSALPEKGKRVGFGPVSYVYSEVLIHLLGKLAELWRDGPEDGADEIFAMLIERMRGERGKFAIDILKKIDAHAGIDRTRRAVLKLLGPDTRIDRSVGQYARTLAVNWLNKLIEPQVVLLIRTEEILGRDPSPAVEEQLLATARMLARLDQAAKNFIEKIQFVAGGDWETVSLDVATMTVCISHPAPIHRFERQQWHELTAYWQRNIERYESPDPDVTIVLKITLKGYLPIENRTDGHDPGTPLDRVFDYILRAKQPATA